MRKTIARIMCMVLLVSTLLMAVACNVQQAEPTGGSITIEVIGPEGEIAKGSIEYCDGDSAHDVSVRYFKENNIAYEESSFGDFCYLSSIGGFKEGSYGAMSGWLYSVNGQDATVGSGQYKVVANDVITWSFYKG